MRVDAVIPMKDGLKLKSRWRLFKWKDPDDKISRFLHEGGSIQEAIRQRAPYEIMTTDGNLALNEGINQLLLLLVGVSGQTSYSAGTAYLGVGDSGATALATQTGLLAPTNKLYKAQDSGYPTVVSQTVTWQSTFASGDANFHWLEETVCNGNSDAGMNLNRATVDKGTKASGETWTLQLIVTPS